MKPQFIIGIDPDLHKPGVAIYNMVTNKLQRCESITFLSLIKELIQLPIQTKDNTIVILEFSTSNNTWHPGGRGAACNTGKGKGAAIIIKEALEELGIPHKLVEPAGYSQAFKHLSVFKAATKWEGKTNEDARAAAAIVMFNKERI